MNYLANCMECLLYIKTIGLFRQFILEHFSLPIKATVLWFISQEKQIQTVDQRYRIVVLRSFVKITGTHLSCFNFTKKESIASVFIL